MAICEAVFDPRARAARRGRKPRRRWRMTPLGTDSTPPDPIKTNNDVSAPGPERNAAGGSGTSNVTAQAILRAAAKVFARVGYDAATVREIAAEAKCGKPMIYYYFKDKAGLARELLLVPILELTARIEQLLAQPLDPVERLERIVGAIVALDRDDDLDRMRFAFATLFSPLNAGFRDQIDKSSCRLIELVDQACQPLVESGRLDPSRRPHLVAAIRGIITVRMLDWLFSNQPSSPELIRRDLELLLYGGLRSEPESGDSPPIER